MLASGPSGVLCPAGRDCGETACSKANILPEITHIVAVQLDG